GGTRDHRRRRRRDHPVRVRLPRKARHSPHLHPRHALYRRAAQSHLPRDPLGASEPPRRVRLRRGRPRLSSFACALSTTRCCRRSAILICMPTAIKTVDPAANEFLAALEAKGKKPSPFFRAMAHRPEVLKNFVPLYGAIMGPGAVDRRIKE